MRDWYPWHYNCNCNSKRSFVQCFFNRNLSLVTLTWQHIVEQKYELWNYEPARNQDHGPESRQTTATFLCWTVEVSAGETTLSPCAAEEKDGTAVRCRWHRDTDKTKKSLPDSYASALRTYTQSLQHKHLLQFLPQKNGCTLSTLYFADQPSHKI